MERKKIKASLHFPLSFPRISFTETINWCRGYKQRATIYTHAAAPPNTEIQTERIYLFVHLSLCNGTPANSIRNIYISRAKLPPLSNHSIDAPHSSLVDYVCKRLPFLSIQFYPENLLKRLIVPVLVAVESPLDQIVLTLSRISGWFSSPLAFSRCVATVPWI